MRALASATIFLASCGRVAFDPAANDAPVDDAQALGAACPTSSDLLACYDFEGDTLDRTGQAPANTAAGVTFIPGIDGMAARFADGSRVDIVAGSLAAGPFTLEAWIRPASVIASRLIYDYDQHWAMGLMSGRPFCGLRMFTTAPGPAVSAGAWSHVACTFDGTRLTLYVNGVASEVLDMGDTYVAVHPAAIGGNAPANQTAMPWVGELDRLRIWSRVRSPLELCDEGGGC